nr:hypothetical protein SPACI_15100 [Sporomusa acidovorans DSM 3132]
MIIAMAAALGSLEIIALGRLDAAKPRTAAHNVDNKTGKFGAGNVGNAFLFQADSRAGRRGHHSGARPGRPIDHVDGRNFTFRL